MLKLGRQLNRSKGLPRRLRRSRGPWGSRRRQAGVRWPIGVLDPIAVGPFKDLEEEVMYAGEGHDVKIAQPRSPGDWDTVDACPISALQILQDVPTRSIIEEQARMLLGYRQSGDDDGAVGSASDRRFLTNVMLRTGKLPGSTEELRWHTPSESSKP